MAGEPTAALRFTGVQRAASVGTPPAIPAQRFRSSGYTAGRWGWFLGGIGRHPLESSTHSFVHWAIL